MINTQIKCALFCFILTASLQLSSSEKSGKLSHLEIGDQTPKSHETQFQTHNLRRAPKQSERDPLNHFEKVKHDQLSAALSAAASEDLGSEAAAKEVLCNSCLVSVVEIAQSLRNAFELASGPLKKAAAVAALQSACSENGEVLKYGLLKEGDRILKAFSKDSQQAVMEKYKYEVIFSPHMTDILKSSCDFLVREYQGDFMVLMSKEHQTLELQANLCGPDPGSSMCSATKDDWTRKAKQHRMEAMKREQQKAAAEAQFQASLEDIEDLKELFDEL